MSKINWKKPGAVLMILAFAVLAMAGAGAAWDEQTLTDYNGKTCVDNCIIIKCDSSAEGAAVADSATVLSDSGSLLPDMLLIETPSGMSVAEAVAYYENLPGVEFAQPDYVYQISNEEVYEVTGPVSAEYAGGTYPVNDPRYSEQWGLTNMKVPEAWEEATGTEDVIVAVIDTGVNYNHEDLKDNMWTDSEGHYGYDFFNNDTDPLDDQGHGTICAGIIGAVTNNGKGIAGVAQHVKIMAVKAGGSDGALETWTITDGINYAVENGARIINISAGVFEYDAAQKKAVDMAAAHGVLIVVAAGNSTTDNDVYPEYPGSYESDSVLTVAALDRDDTLASYSSYGKITVDVAAPGGGINQEVDGILSTHHSSNDDYIRVSGTSFSAPMVSGLAALLLSEKPSLTSADLKCIIMATTTPEPTLTEKTVTGGAVNAQKALENVDTVYHMITFKDDKDKEIGTQVVKDGDKASAPEDPSQYFKKFDGWYTDKEYTTLWNFETKITGNTTLYARFIEDTSYDADTSWYVGHESDTSYTLTTASQLRGLSKLAYFYEGVKAEDRTTWPFYGKTILLGGNIDLAGEEWIPISVASVTPFIGTFDGNGYTISGLSINLPKENYVGFFGYNCGSVKNLNLVATTVTGYNNVGTLGGYIKEAKDITVTADKVSGYQKVGGLGGNIGKAENIEVTVDKVSGYQKVGGVFGYNTEDNSIISHITVTCKDGVYADDEEVGGAFGMCMVGFDSVTVYAGTVSGKRKVGGIAGVGVETITDCSAVIGNLETKKEHGGGAIGYYNLARNVGGETQGTGAAMKNILVSANGTGQGGVIGTLNVFNLGPGSSAYLGLENLLVTGNLSSEKGCGGIVGNIINDNAVPTTVSFKNSVVLLNKISNKESEKEGRLYGTTADMVTITAATTYGWEGTTNSTGTTFTPSEKNGINVAASEVWNNQAFFDNLGWDFENTWQINTGNSSYKLPVLQNTIGTGKLNAAYLAPQTNTSSVTAFFGEKDGNDFTFKKAVVITKATLPGATYATVTNTSGNGWYTCNLSTDGTNGVVYFQVPLDVVRVKGWTVNDVSVSDAKTTYLTSENGYAKYSAVITGAGSYTIDFEKDAAGKAVEKVQEVVEQKQTAAEQKQAAAEKVQEVVEQKQTTQTAAKTPFPLLGILAGLGIAGVLVMRRR